MYQITEEEQRKFFSLYHGYVFGTKPHPEYLTEKQLETGPLAIDLDFRYADSDRHYTDHDIHAFLELTLECIENMFPIAESFPIYVFEKKDVNATSDTVTKDGIHMIIGINMDRVCKTMLRTSVLRGMPDIWESLREHLTNDDAAVLDDGVFHGTTNWQLYGSRKPNHAAYKLTSVYTCTMPVKGEAADGFVLRQDPLHDFVSNLDKNLVRLSVRYDKYETPVLNDECRAEYEKLTRPAPSPQKRLRVVSDDTSAPIQHARIRNKKGLDSAIARLTGGDKPRDAKQNEYKEIHDYVMLLPSEFYGPGSYDKWMRAAWALRNTGFDYFPVWVKMSAKSPDFSFTDVSKMFGDWTSWDLRNLTEGKGLTSASIRYWAKNHDPVAYNRISRSSLSYRIDKIVRGDSESGQEHINDYDLAQIVYHMFKDDFVCASIGKKVWYEYVGQRWAETDSGQTIRVRLSTDVYEAFVSKLPPLREEMAQEDNTDKCERLNKYIARTLEICAILKRAPKKENIMREACDLFYVKNFVSLLDSKDHIICFNNGVFDFEEKVFRPGRHDDYTSKSTKIDYVPIDQQRDGAILAEINEFWEQLFPVEELRNYMKDHAASLLLGKNNNQTFNIYTGAGRNGKSKFVELMSLVLGEYKATVPVSLVTAKRNGIGSLSPEIAQLFGCRYAVMQEPSKGDRINEGVMKELTGGDPIQCRALYKDAVTFYPQFKLAVCTNNLFDIKSNDDGTWRRIRVCKFMSLFTEDPVTDDSRKPYQFKVDKWIDEKFHRWKIVFVAMLVARAMVTMGEVVDCPMVMADSEDYRQDQDCFAEFVKDCLTLTDSGSLGVEALHESFKEWWSRYQSGGAPKGKELFQYITREFGAKGKDKRWKGITLHMEYDDDGIEEDE